MFSFVLGEYLGVELLGRCMFTFKAEWSFKNVSNNVTPLFTIFQWLPLLLEWNSRKYKAQKDGLLSPQLNLMLLLTASPASGSHSSLFLIQAKRGPDSLTSLLLPQPRTLFSQPITWLISCPYFQCQLKCYLFRENWVLERLSYASGRPEMQIHANSQCDPRALALSILKHKPSFNCMSCDRFLPCLSHLPFTVYSTSVCFIFFFAFSIPWNYFY